MHADDQPDLHAGRADAYPCKDETHAIIGCAFEVLNELGHGLVEKCYENALVVEFRRRSIPFVQQPRFEVLYKAELVGEFVPDLVVFNTVVADPKVVDRITSGVRCSTTSRSRACLSVSSSTSSTPGSNGSGSC